MFDDLTELANRRLFRDRLDQAIRRFRRYGQRFALLLIDLNRFKDVNDALGHAAGDELLREVARRLRHRMRSTDTVARLGGDEFAVILDPCGCEDAKWIAASLEDLLAQPARVHDNELPIYASIGIACMPDHGVTAEALIGYADNAMYQAKRNSARSGAP